MIEELGGSKAHQEVEKVEIPTVPEDLFLDFALSSITLDVSSGKSFDLPSTLVFNGFMAGYIRVHSSNPPGIGLVCGSGLHGGAISDGRIRGPDGSLLNTVQRVVIYGGDREQWIRATYVNARGEFVASFYGRWPRTWPAEVVKAAGRFQFQTN